MNTRRKGSAWEQKAADYLEKSGHVILERNFQCRYGEIDIITRLDRTIVFCEVKYRSSGEYGLPSEAVNFGKQRKISNTASYYLYSHGYPPDTPCRFDVVVLSDQAVQLYADAFPYCGNFSF